MILIAHRGNIDGKIESYENEPNYIDLAIKKGYDVEIDVWVIEGTFHLGHDKPQYSISLDWLYKRKNKLWIHCKNIEAIEWFNSLIGTYHYFWHQEDTVTLTSKNFIWAYPNKQPIENSIAVMPELCDDDVSQCLGICSDYIEKYKNENNI
jgi:hypothetical protein